MRDLIAQGALGQLHSVTGAFTYGLADPGNIRLSADLAGGALRDVGVYPIGAFRFATGREPQILWADAIREKYDEAIHLMVLLVDERPEEVTEFRRALPGAEIYAS